MKKLLVLLFALMLVFCACRRTTPDETTVTTEDEPEVTVNTGDVTTNEGTDTSTFEDVEVKEPEIAPGVDVKYEVLTLDNEELNAILETRSADMLASYIPNISSVHDLGGTAEYDVKLEGVYKSDRILSAVFSGRYAIYYENSEEGGEVLYTVNIDPVSGRILETSDIVDYDKMVAAFKGKTFDTVPDFSQYNSAYGIYPYVYLDGENITVFITKNGMYQEVLRYSIPYSEAQDFLKIED